MTPYLTVAELAGVTGCAPQSYTAMCRRLKAMGWPHQPRNGQCPLVLRSVHDSILNGKAPAAVARTKRPNFEALA